ncbi:AI-2E family transporter, partial [Desulfovibrio sp. XJ01]|nr:AI-2E family transporter [Nitratidesulfovibrio liaohensis]
MSTPARSPRRPLHHSARPVLRRAATRLSPSCGGCPGDVPPQGVEPFAPSPCAGCPSPCAESEHGSPAGQPEGAAPAASFAPSAASAPSAPSVASGPSGPSVPPMPPTPSAPGHAAPTRVWLALLAVVAVGIGWLLARPFIHTLAVAIVVAALAAPL